MKKTLLDTETRRDSWRIEERYVVTGNVARSWHYSGADGDEAWAWFQMHRESYPWRYTPYNARRLVLLAVVTSAFDAFKQRVEAHRAAGHPGGVGGCKACPAPAAAVKP